MFARPGLLNGSLGDPTTTLLSDSANSGTFEYQQGSPAVTLRVTYHDIIGQLVGLTVTTNDGVIPDVDLDQASIPAPTDAPNIFKIYIAASDLTSYISISEVDPLNTTGAVRHENPFTSGAGNLLVANASTVGDPTYSYAPTGGQVLVGNKHDGTTDADVPIYRYDYPVVNGTQTVSAPLGVYPGNESVLTAGIQMASTNLLTGAPNDIGEMLVGGTILGTVAFPAAPVGTAPLGASQGGNVGLFYAGTLLTGTATGVFQVAAAPASGQTANFTIGGDLRDLYTFGDIGGSSGGLQVVNGHYFTGFDMTVAGTLGDIYQNSGDMLGTMDIQHSPSIYGLPETLFPEMEVEYNAQAPFTVGDIFEGALTEFPKLGAPFTNGSTNQAQYLGSISASDPNSGALLTDPSGNIIYNGYATGLMQASLPSPESDDDYAVPLLAGQTITITLNDGGSQLVDARLIDPSGRTVASDENNGGSVFTLGQAFSYTADRPGEYTIDVHYIGPSPADDPYTLTVGGIGNMALGTISSPGYIYDDGYDGGYEFDHGDLGAFLGGIAVATGTAPGAPADPASTAAPATSIYVVDGSMREMQGGSIGLLVNGTLGEGPYLKIPNGALGLVQATSGILDLETNYDPLVQYGLNSYDPGSPIGGNIQMIDGAGQVIINAATNGGIGDILVGGILGTTNFGGFIDVNADNSGNDGVIDLIDVAGDLGTLSAGGPAIVTHTGGNVRYMVVGGTIYEDTYFGGGSPSTVNYSAAQAATLTDDSGSSIVLTPTGQTSTVTTLNTDGSTSQTTLGPQLTVQTYGIRDKGGVVVVDVTSTGGLAVTSNGTSGNSSQAEIGTVTITGNAPVVGLGTTTTATSSSGSTTIGALDGNGEQVYTDTTNTGLPGVDSAGHTTTLPGFGLMVTGSASTGVMRVNVVGGGVLVTGITQNNANFIENLTQGGEIGGISVGSVGTILSYGTIGLLKSSTGTAVLPLNDFFSLATDPGNSYPFVDQGNGVVALNNVYSIQAYQGLGNIFVIGGIQQITANANGKLSGNGFEGINGPIVAEIASTIPLSGRILNVSIGQGILPTGTGLVGFSGLFAQSDIGTVTNNGYAEGDIRGAIVSVTNIDNVTLLNGSIINSIIAQVDNFNAASPIGPGATITALDSPVTAPIYTLKNVSVTGRGGIIGSTFIAANIGVVSVGAKGFGIFSSNFSGGGNAVVNQIVAGGYGIRDSSIVGGASLNLLDATGNGSELSVASFGNDLRQSETTTTDPYFNTGPNPLTDLDAFLGTSISTPVIAGVTDTGAIEDVIATGSTSLGAVAAQTIRTSLPLFSESDPLNPSIPVLGSELFPMSLSFAGSTGSVLVRGIIDGLQLTTGNLGRFVPGGSVSRCGLAVSGAINKLVIHGNYGQTFTSPLSGLTVPDSYIEAIGSDGQIGTLKITGSLNGDVIANSRIGNITIGGNVVGSITINGQTKGLALGTIRINGTLTGGSLVIDGSAKSIITSGSLGSLGDSLTVTGSLGSLTVGANHNLRGSDLALNLNIQEGLGSLNVFGRIDGNVNIAGNLGKLQVINDGTQGNVISGAITVNGALGTAKIIGGNIAADVTANGDIGNFTVSNGSVLAGDVITSRIGTLKKFSLKAPSGGGLLGSINTPNGVNESISIGGNFGDGVTAASILAYSASLVRITGAMAGNTSITTTNALGLLEIDGGLGQGATVTGHPIGKQKIAGINLGTITSD